MQHRRFAAVLGLAACLLVLGAPLATSGRAQTADVTLAQSDDPVDITPQGRRGDVQSRPLPPPGESNDQAQDRYYDDRSDDRGGRDGSANRYHDDQDRDDRYRDEDRGRAHRDGGGPPPEREYGARPNYAPRDYVPPPADDASTFSIEEVRLAGHRFFGNVSLGLARVIEYAFSRYGRPNGYVLGEEAGGALIAGLRYGEGTLFTKNSDDRKVYWQGPSVGYDFGAEGSKTMVLAYNLRDPNQIYRSFGGIDGSAYLVGGVGITFQTDGKVILAPIRSGLGLRLGANVGYLKYTRQPTWNPF